MSPQKQRLMLIILAGIFGVMVLVGIFFAYAQSQKGKIIVTATPKDMTLKLDGAQISANGTTFMEPGAHELIGTRRTFTDKKMSFTIAKGETKAITFYMLPEGSAGLEWVKQNPEEAAVLDGYIGKEYNDKVKKVFSDNTILQQLPVVDSTFRIDHGISKTGRDFALYIQAADQTGRDNALATLKYLGFDPAAYEIIYVDPANSQAN